MTEHTGFSGYPHHTPAIRRIMHRRFALRAGGAVLWFLAWTLFCFFWGAEHNEYFSRFNWTLLGALIGLLGWRIFRIGDLLRDHEKLREDKKIRLQLDLAYRKMMKTLMSIHQKNLNNIQGRKNNVIRLS